MVLRTLLASWLLLKNITKLMQHLIAECLHTIYLTDQNIELRPLSKVRVLYEDMFTSHWTVMMILKSQQRTALMMMKQEWLVPLSLSALFIAQLVTDNCWTELSWWSQSVVTQLCRLSTHHHHRSLYLPPLSCGPPWQHQRVSNNQTVCPQYQSLFRFLQATGSLFSKLGWYIKLS